MSKLYPIPGGGDSSYLGKPIWQLAQANNKKPTVVRRRRVTEHHLRYGDYHGVFQASTNY